MAEGKAAGWEPEYEAYGEKLLRAYGTPAASVAVAEEGRLVYHRGFGHRDAEGRLPVTPDTVFGIGSITKSFTAVAILKLQEAGLLSVEDPVVRYLPEFRTPDEAQTKAITIHHFLTHTSGLPPLPSLQLALLRSFREDPDVKDQEGEEVVEKLRTAKPIDTYEQLLAFIAETPFELLGPPGRYFSYSNDAYALLGAIVERVSGERYEDYVTRHILAPCGMDSSTFDVPSRERFPDLADLFAEKRKDGEPYVAHSPVWWQAPSMTAAGFLRSSARDMLRYLDIFRTGGLAGEGRVLSEGSVRLMTAPHARCGQNMYYGYGLMITPGYDGVTLVEHGGNIKGAAAWASVVPERGWTGIALTNLVSSPADQLILSVWNARLGLPLDRRHEVFEDYALPADRLAEYEGRFVSGEGAAVDVRAQGGGLEFTIGKDTYRARPVGPDRFAVRVKELEAPVAFLRREDGRIWAMAFSFRIVRRAGDEAARAEKAGA
ncbi:MAG: serine hydrolase [Clostridia bacterium]|nr:serine hydrolase [Clostridia bacterium]